MKNIDIEDFQNDMTDEGILLTSEENFDGDIVEEAVYESQENLGEDSLEKDEEISEEELIKRLEEEGDIAADYLEEFLDIADLDGDIDIDVDHGRASLAVVCEDSDSYLEDIVGKNGEVLEALQELTRLAVQTKTGERSRIMLDIAGFRANRKAEIAEIAEEAVRRCKESGEVVHIDAMNPFERKVVHDIAAAAGLVSDSEGVAPNRHVMIHPSEEN